MTTGWVVALGLAATGLLAATLGWQRGRRAESARTVGSAFAVGRGLLRLLRLLQQHRGLSSGWLAGNGGFAGRMLARRQEIEEVLGDLVALVGRGRGLSASGLSPQRLGLFRRRWGDTVADLQQSTVEQNIAEHGFLIAEILEWLSSLAEGRFFGGGEDPLVIGIGRNFAQRLPALSEFLGQARAIGSSVAARQACSPVARVRLVFLIARAEAILAQAWEAGAANPAERPAAEAARKAVGAMTALVRTRMLLSSGIAVSADTYFEVATAAIDAVFAWAEDCGRDMEERIAMVQASSLAPAVPGLALGRGAANP
jgi:hypothetical protein